MRKLSHLAACVLATGASPALAQLADATPIIVPSQSSIYNQNAVNLPAAPIVNGQDVVRGVTGVSCQTAIASAGPYFDVGVIGSQDVYARDTAAVYGRLVIPLGQRPKRLDCSKLYDLEIARLRMEIDLMRLGMPIATAAAGARPASDGVAAAPLPPH